MYSTYRNREHGLPYPGSYLQQPAKLVEAWSIVDGALAEVDRFKEKRDRLRGSIPGG